MGHSKTALETRQASVNRREALSTLVDRGNAEFDAGEFSAARESFAAAMELLATSGVGADRRFAVCHYDLARACAALGDNKTAEYHYWEAVKVRPRFPQALNNLGMLLNQAERFDEAVDVFRRCVAAEPLMASAYYGLGVALQSAGKDSDAAFAYQRALNLNPDFAPSWNNLGIVCLGIGSIEVAANCFLEAIALTPDDARVYHHLGLAHMAAERFTQAVAAFSKAVELQPDFTEAREALEEALYFRVQKDNGEAPATP